MPKALVGNLLMKDWPFSLANEVQRKYDLSFASQPICEIQNFYENGEKKCIKEELLVRSNDENLELVKLLKDIDIQGDNFWLFCYMFINACKISLDTWIPQSVNVNISDVVDWRFMLAIEEILCYFWKPSVTLEILEWEPLPECEDTRRHFFDKLRYLKDEKDLKIFLDDLGWIDEDSWMMYCDFTRVEEFQSEWVLDGVKIDLKTVRESFREFAKSSDWNVDRDEYLRKVFALQDSVNTTGVSVWVGEKLQALKKKNPDLKIIAEGVDMFEIDSSYTIGNLWIKAFLSFLNERLHVDYVQWYALWKPR